MEGDSLVGELFAGRFQIESVIGRGGMGVVFLATHVVLGRRVAIKILRRSLLERPGIAARFRREARAASRIEHPHITTVFDFGHTEEGRPYLAMEYEDGPTLAAEIARHGRLSAPRTVDILAQCAEALAAAHAQEVIHRDLKPKNIVLITRRGVPDFVKILDFGLAKIMGLGADDQQLTEDGQSLGTPRYMAPEQFLGEKMDQRGDIYTLGLVAFEALVGRPPFEGDTVTNIAVQHVHQPAPVVSEASGRADVPPALDAVVARCLAKDPGDRYQEARELHADLRRLHEDPVQPTPPRRKTSRLYAISHGTRPAPREPSTDEQTVSDWPATQEPAGPDRRPRALEELACAARDLGIGSPEISHVLSRKLQAEDLVIELEAELAVIDATVFELETTARERESRLRQALNQLEHEQEVLLAPPAGEQEETVDTQPWDAEAFNRACEERRELEARSAEITAKIQQISRQLEQELGALQEQVEQKRRTMRTLRQEVARYEAQLATLLAGIKPRVLELDDPELVRLLELAGL
jgi:serine/threonine protein kinase